MAGEFIPFLASVKNGGVATKAASAQFAPVSTASATAAHPVGAVIAAPGIPAAKPVLSTHTHGQVNIELKRDGSRVSQIRIQCRCGELIEIDCEY